MPRKNLDLQIRDSLIKNKLFLSTFNYKASYTPNKLGFLKKLSAVYFTFVIL